MTESTGIVRVRKTVGLFSQSVGLPPAITIPGGLILYYPFDNVTTSGATTSDLSGNNNNGTLIGSPTTGVTGEIGQAFTFNGSTQYVEATTSSLITAAPLTICFWANLASTTNGLGVGIFNANATNAWDTWFVETSGSPSTVWDSVTGANTVFTKSSGATAHTGQWDFICGVFTSSALRQCFVNNTGDTADTTSMTPTITNGPRVDVGVAHAGINAPSTFFPGSIDDVRIYNRALSSAERTAIYNAGLAGSR